ncbi:MAG TPA: phage tail assembly chaperone, partial [Sphingomicrobium sp.]|nr:phage tail assembly chaperone [Sphingomicrobium sp.]
RRSGRGKGIGGHHSNAEAGIDTDSARPLTVERFGETAARLCNAAAMLLGWRPDEFWKSTPAELALALQAPGAAADAPDPATIEELRRRFPDE